jgi:hypothetical protein
LAEVLDNMAQMIRQRFKLRRQLLVITAQGRISGYVLAVLPIVLGFVPSRDRPHPGSWCHRLADLGVFLDPQDRGYRFLEAP